MVSASIIERIIAYQLLSHQQVAHSVGSTVVDGMRLDDFARAAGVPTTTVRLYQAKGLLPGPRLVGRTGYYDESHLTRLRLITKLQDEGFSLAAVGRVLEEWEQGRNLDTLLGVEREVGDLLGGPRPVVVDPDEVVRRFPQGVLTPELVQRAAALGLIELTEDGRIRVHDPRSLETGAALAHLGIPTEAILDQWAALIAHTDDIAASFVALFEEYLLPVDWHGLSSEQSTELGGTLDRLHQLGREVIVAAFDTSLAKEARRRLRRLAPE
jgi:DNA-binding transcriptional MerR regulator